MVGMCFGSVKYFVTFYRIPIDFPTQRTLQT